MEDDHTPFATMAGGVRKRASGRASMLLRADVHREAAAPLEGLRVRNLSAGGLMVETPQPFASGEAVSVVLRNIGEVAGRVAWTKPGQVGIGFDREIDPAEVRKAPHKSPGATMQLLRPESESRRPRLKAG